MEENKTVHYGAWAVLVLIVSGLSLSGGYLYIRYLQMSDTSNSTEASIDDSEKYEVLGLTIQKSGDNKFMSYKGTNIDFDSGQYLEVQKIALVSVNSVIMDNNGLDLVVINPETQGEATVSVKGLVGFNSADGESEVIAVGKLKDLVSEGDSITVSLAYVPKGSTLTNTKLKKLYEEYYKGTNNLELAMETIGDFGDIQFGRDEVVSVVQAKGAVLSLDDLMVVSITKN